MVEEIKSETGSEASEKEVLKDVICKLKENDWTKFRIYCIQHHTSIKNFVTQSIKEKINTQQS